jgi:hypothetical protein
MVITLVVILLMLTISKLSFMQAWLVKADLDTLSALCRHAQQRALLTGREQTVILDPAQRCYHFNNRVYSLSPGVQFGFIPGIQGPPSHPRLNITKPITFVNNRIICFEHGVISSGTVYLTNTDATILYALSNAVAHTSFLRTYIYRGTWTPLA